MEISNTKKYLLEHDNSLIDAIKKLNTNKYKTILVVNKFNKLIGTITDGDIRRALLKGHDKSSNIKKRLNKKPKKIYFGRKFAYSKETDAEILPVVDKSEKLKSIFINDKYKKRFKNRRKLNEKNSHTTFNFFCFNWL